MFKKLILPAIVFLLAANISKAQAPDSTVLGNQNSDTLKTRLLSEITIVGAGSKSDIHQLPQIVGTNIYAGKKSSLVILDNVQGNIVNNTMRQILAKVPGIFIWESEGSGIQVGISARGLSPNRSWEFNVRQNGYDIAADPYGYPEAYYNPQMQAVQRIEIVRGQGALQYGPQIGGMVNYILKNGSNFTKPVQVETFQTVGSNGLFNTYNAIGGKTKKVNYYTFFDHRNAEGWRNNNQYNSNTGSGTVTYKFSEKLSITADLTYWHARSQQPGGLTDEQFNQNPQQSLRARNWFDLTWATAAIHTDYKISENQRLTIKLFGMNGDRNSIGFNPSNGILTADVVDINTGKYANRTLDKDQYRNYGLEARYLHHYSVGKNLHSLSTGVRLYSGSTFRFRGGVGSNGSAYDDAIQTGTTWTGNIEYKSGNVAWFAENMFQLTDRIVLIPGIRYEYITAKASGYSSLVNNVPVYLQNQQQGRGFVIAGLGAEYRITKNGSLYANATQSYRPVQFADLTTPPTTDVIDPNLTDSKGLNVDLGYRGHHSDFLKFDVSVYHLQYDNRIGSIKQQRLDNSFYNLRTNVGSSSSKGLELFTEYNITRSLSASKRAGEVSVFASYSYTDARYNSFKVITTVNNALQETNYQNRKVEYAPENILRAGLSYAFQGFSTTLQYSFTDQVFSDANNTLVPTANGQNGKIPSYKIIDVAFAYKHRSGLQLKSGINNLMNENYFTRRAGGYPGPGVLPSDGRTFFVTVGFVMP